MLDWLARRLEVSSTVAGILVALVVVQLGMQVYALVDLARRSAVRGAPKWLWACIIALGNLPGAIVYLAAGRIASNVDEPTASTTKAGGREGAQRAVDALYGKRDRD